MNIDLLKQEISREEGFIPCAYKDSLGYWTIGIGRLIDRRKGGGISQEEAEYLLVNDIEKTIAGLHKALPWFDGTPEIVQRALINMAFQMGVEGLLGFKNTLDLIRQGKYSEAADNALKSKWAIQTPQRAKRVTNLIRKGEN